MDRLEEQFGHMSSQLLGLLEQVEQRLLDSDTPSSTNATVEGPERRSISPQHFVPDGRKRKITNRSTALAPI